MGGETIAKELYEFERIKEILKKQSFTERRIAKYMDKFIPDHEGMTVYGKNVISEEPGAKIELYFFTSDKIYVVKEIDTGIKYQLMYTKDINHIDYEISDADEKIVTLKIKLLNGELLTLSSVNDRGAGSLLSYRNMIEHIVKTLI
ncbi:hypothetical protein B4147_0297 [Bacillus wiedmannii]|uniref:DUF3908 domain-containing protein n=1 Tax=Bacillus wiedmannii TaxID=1890302 RepID=A0A0G8BV31_9BACI|nr:DUF3908 family protein [Bacillus wiedmannii]KKZ90934.1 hypothetical protein B4147_0297 [Bacillus wiedmannii]